MRFIFVCAALVTTGALAQEEVLLQNDSLMAGDTGAIQLGFVPGEIAAATFYPDDSLFPLKVNAIQIFWTSFAGGQPDSLQESILVYSGALPNPGAPVFQEFGPLMVDGFMNQFDLTPFNVVIEEPGPITVGLEFSKDAPNGQPTSPSVVTDVDGCQFGLNPLFAIPGGWLDLCLFGASGDFVIRALVQQTEVPCVADFNMDGSLNVLDFVAFQLAFQQQDEAADVNGDGAFNIIDFATFQVLWQAGCDD